MQHQPQHTLQPIFAYFDDICGAGGEDCVAKILTFIPIYAAFNLQSLGQII